MKKTTRVISLIVAVAVLASLAASSSLVATSATPSQQTSARLISDQLVGEPVGAGHYLFWLVDGGKSIYGYDVDTGQQFLVGAGKNTKTNLTSIGQQLRWVEQTAVEGGVATQYSVQSYSIGGNAPAAQGHVSTLLNFTNTEQTKILAIDQDNLYYEVHYSRPGVYARSLTTGQERQFLSYSGYNFVARDEGLLWTEVYCSPCGKYGAEGYRLHLLLHGSSKDTVVADVFGQDFDYPGYDISGDNVVWVSMPGTHNGVHLYSIKSELSRVIAEGDAHQPLISRHLVLWTTVGNTYPDPFGYPSIIIYDLDKMEASTMAGADSGRVEAEAIGDTGVLVYVNKGSIYVAALR